MAQPNILSPGARIADKYEVVEIIGFGGMGVVYKVREQVGSASRIRALKTILPQYVSDAGIIRRFREEAEKMCILEHENIVPVLSYSEEAGLPYLVMPFIEGQTLKEYLASYVAEYQHPLRLSEVMEIGLEIVRGLEVAHRFVNPETRRPQPMIHRDIKPGNIMVRIEERGGERRLKVLIMDFGIAKVVSEEDTGHSLTDVIGTVKYASPEQVRRGKDIDPRADIYSLGMVLYELYSGRHMFADRSEHMVLMHMMQRQVEEILIEFPADTPGSFQELIRRSVAVDRDQRYPNVTEMREVMRRILEEDTERHLVETQRARDQATRGRGTAVDAGAPDLAAQTFAEGEGLLKQATDAETAREYTAGARFFRAAAAAFERAAVLAADERERRRLTVGLAALSPLRDAARSAHAGRFAANELAAAERFTEAAERALRAGELTASARALAQAERAWREAESLAARERRRAEVVHRRDEIARSLAALAVSYEEMPARLRARAGMMHLDAARAAVADATSATDRGDFEPALARLVEAATAIRAATAERDATLGETVVEIASDLASRLAEAEATGHHLLIPTLYNQARAAAGEAENARAAGRLAEACTHFERAVAAAAQMPEAISTRLAERQEALRRAEQERSSARYLELRHRATAASQVLAALGREVEPHAESRGVFAELARAEERAAQGGLADAVAALEVLVPRLALLVEETQARAEHQHATARTEEARRRADDALEAARRVGEGALRTEAWRQATACIADAERSRATGELAAAEAAYREAERILGDLLADVERAERAERFARLHEQARRLELRLGPRPRDRPRKRFHKQAAALLKRAESLLERGHETDASKALGDCQALVERLAAEPTLFVQTRSPRARSRKTAAAIVGGLVLVAGGYAILRSVRSDVPLERTEPGAVPTLPSPLARTLETPTIAVAKSEETPAAFARATVEVPSPIEERQKPAPERPPPLALASAYPVKRSLQINAGAEQRFEARVSGADPSALVWELDGKPAGRGARFSLTRDAARAVGAHRLALVAIGQKGRTDLTSWDIEVQALALEFALLEPQVPAIERFPGSTVSFRAAVKNADAVAPAFVWEVNGKREGDARGASYEFAARDPGQYTVLVRAVAPWGASIDKKWNVTVKPVLPRPTQAIEESLEPPTKVDVEAELRAWIQSYCRAFEQKDTAKLIELGQVKDQNEAERLAEALSVMNNLKLSCTNPSIQAGDNQAVVSFDRTDRWTDPRGSAMERPLPRITKNLRRTNGRWVVTQ